ncbi:hypothetical protein G6M04_00365 [Agrobacterium rhizogenes]|uniref:hypothetical protein n=1 Tax=Rhizobium rhizogenes TaxID=359 RepID=UPI0015744B2E|nr:hypothetical protein [Rhizobium rhizogenes]NTG45807.1 hypothetical protein [Rhizobium rhizogenes]
MTNSKSLIRKANRAAQSIVGGDRLLARLTSAPYLRELKKGVAESVPPVSKISRMLQEDFPSEPEMTLPVRQFIGMTVRAILAAEGYEVEERGVRISGDPVFRTGATYRLAVSGDDEEEDFLVRFVGMLTTDELHRLKDLVNASL